MEYGPGGLTAQARFRIFLWRQEDFWGRTHVWHEMSQYVSVNLTFLNAFHKPGAALTMPINAVRCGKYPSVNSGAFGQRWSKCIANAWKLVQNAVESVECSKFVQSLSQSTLWSTLCTELCAGVIIIQFDSMVELPSGVTLNQDRSYKCQRTPGLYGYVYNMRI